MINKIGTRGAYLLNSLHFGKLRLYLNSFPVLNGNIFVQEHQLRHVTRVPAKHTEHAVLAWRHVIKFKFTLGVSVDDSVIGRNAFVDRFQFLCLEIDLRCVSNV